MRAMHALAGGRGVQRVFMRAGSRVWWYAASMHDGRSSSSRVDKVGCLWFVQGISHELQSCMHLEAVACMQVRDVSVKISTGSV
jgi:hypothetical protein